jgi:hypothetical protein
MQYPARVTVSASSWLVTAVIALPTRQSRQPHPKERRGRLAGLVTVEPWGVVLTVCQLDNDVVELAVRALRGHRVEAKLVVGHGAVESANIAVSIAVPFAD